MHGTPLPRDFYDRPSLAVAPDLLGMLLVYERGGRRRVGRIVETEAYQGPEDLAAHSARGRTARTEVMFGPPGHAYVYLIYGMWNCLNVVTAAGGTPHAVLLRAVEPLAGLAGPGWGPGLLCRAFGIGRELNGADLCGAVAGGGERRSRLWIARPEPLPPVRVGRSARIGVEYAGSWARRPWRFFERGSAHVSTLTPAARRAAAAADAASRQGAHPRPQPARAAARRATARLKAGTRSRR